jgi:hypothetical protein
MCVLDKSPCDALGKQLKGTFFSILKCNNIWKINFNFKNLSQLHCPKWFHAIARIVQSNKHKMLKNSLVSCKPAILMSGECCIESTRQQPHKRKSTIVQFSLKSFFHNVTNLAIILINLFITIIKSFNLYTQIEKNIQNYDCNWCVQLLNESY